MTHCQLDRIQSYAFLTLTSQSYVYALICKFTFMWAKSYIKMAVMSRIVDALSMFMSHSAY